MTFPSFVSPSWYAAILVCDDQRMILHLRRVTNSTLPTFLYPSAIVEGVGVVGGNPAMHGVDSDVNNKKL